MSDCPIFLRSDDESRRAQRIRVRAVLLLSPRSGAVAPRTLFFELGSCYGLVAEAPELPGEIHAGGLHEFGSGPGNTLSKKIVLIYGLNY